MERDYLLTYVYINSEGMNDSDFAWFGGYRELLEFVREMEKNIIVKDFEISEVIRINSCEILYDCDRKNY